MAERIREIEWTHNGEFWVATVGETLHGRRVRTRRARGKPYEETTALSDPALVLAIFPGASYWVATNARPLTPVVSYWVNPLMAGHPTAVRRFDPPTSETL